MPDSLAAVVWLGVTLLLVRASWVLGRRFFPDDGSLACVLHTVVLGWASLVATTVLLGVLGILSRWTLLGSVASVSALMFWASRSVPARIAGASLHNEKSAASSVEAQSARRRSRGEVVWLVLWGAGVSWMGSRMVLSGLLKFPSNYDTLTYHLPLPVQWLRQGSLYAPDDAQWSVPGNNEVLGLWLIAPFSGDFLIALNNFPAILLLATAAVELGNVVGLRYSLSHLGAWTLLAVRPVLQQMTDAENDVAVAGLFMGCLCYGVRFACRGQRADLVLFGVSVGLLAGVKYYALGYAAVAGGGLVLLTLACRGWRAMGLVVCIGLLGGLLWGGYWYTRNWWVTGAPLYPRGFTSSTNLQGQIHADVWQTTLLGNPQPEKLALLLRALWRMDGPCQWLAFYVLPFTIAWMIASCIWFCYEGKVTSGVFRIALAFWAVAAGFVWSVTPFLVETVPGTLNMLRGGFSPARFGFCFLGLALLCLVATVQDIGRGIHHLLVSALPSPNSYGAMRHLWSLILGLFTAAPSLMLSGAVIYQLVEHILPTKDKADIALLAADFLLAGISIVFALSMWRRHQLLLSAALIVVFVGATAGINCLAQRWHAEFAAHYNTVLGDKLCARLSQMDPNDTRICVLGYRYYPFFGSQHQFRVSRPLWVPTYASFLQYLRDHDATLVAAMSTVDPGVRRYGDGRDWLLAHPELFEVIQDGPRYLVCRVNRGGLARALASR